MARVCMHADIFADMQQLYKGLNVRKREFREKNITDSIMQSYMHEAI